MKNQTGKPEVDSPTPADMRLGRETLMELSSISLLGAAGGTSRRGISYGNDTRVISTGNVQCPNREICE